MADKPNWRDFGYGGGAAEDGRKAQSDGARALHRIGLTSDGKVVRDYLRFFISRQPAEGMNDGALREFAAELRFAQRFLAFLESGDPKDDDRKRDDS